MLTEDTAGDVEGDTLHLLNMADADDGAPPTLPELCLRLLGRKPRRARRMLHQGALETSCQGEHAVWIRSDVPDRRLSWVIGHELAHWYYEHISPFRGTQEELEYRCDSLGAALVLPSRFLRRLVRRFGDRPDRIATMGGTTQSVALLRLGEVHGTPTILVRDQKPPISRGAPWQWPNLSVEGARSLKRHGVQVVPIRDEPRKTGLVASL